MAILHTHFGHVAKAVELLQQANNLGPGSPDILSDLGHALCSFGDVTEALDAFHASVEIDPANLTTWSRLLLTAHYLPSLSRKDIFALHVRAGTAISPAGVQPVRPSRKRARSETRVRIAYLSADFFGQSVMAQIEPVLKHHDRTKFKVTCYSDARRQDAATDRIKTYDLHWHETASLTADALSELIRSDEIDILVDLAGHTGEGRLRVLASSPAPIQISSFGYPDTTGLNTVDYRITDSFTDPPGDADQFYTEKLLRIDPCFFCYQPACETGLPEFPLPRTDHFVFCSFNALPKISSTVVQLWASILTQAPDAALLLKALEFIEPEARSRLTAKFEVFGIAPERIQIIPPLADRLHHLALYQVADMALDTFPYSGTITTCEALWMGVPVVTLPGETHVSRVTGAILHTIGRPEWVATSPEEYVAIAIREYGRGKRSLLRRNNLRRQVSDSPLMCQPEYVRKLENAYHSILGVGT